MKMSGCWKGLRAGLLKKMSLNLIENLNILKSVFSYHWSIIIFEKKIDDFVLPRSRNRIWTNWDEILEKLGRKTKGVNDQGRIPSEGIIRGSFFYRIWSWWLNHILLLRWKVKKFGSLHDGNGIAFLPQGTPTYFSFRIQAFINLSWKTKTPLPFYILLISTILLTSMST